MPRVACWVLRKAFPARGWALAALTLVAAPLVSSRLLSSQLSAQSAAERIALDSLRDSLALIPDSVALHRLEAQLVRRLGIQELGVGRGDLALVRPTWMPSILTEGMFLMIPEQENALRSASGQRLYAQAVYDGTLAFLRDRARAQTGRPSRP